MPSFVIDAVIAFLILGMTYALSSEGLWGAALMCFNVIFSGIIAFNFYEPMAAAIAHNASAIAGHADSFSMMLIFVACVWIFRLTTESLAPAMVRYPSILYQLGRFFFGFVGATVTLAIIVLSFEASAVHKKVFGHLDYKFKPPFGQGIDREWLAFMQWTTGAIFADYRGTPDTFMGGEYKNAKVFDPRGEWLLRHQEVRPYGEGPILSGEEGGGSAAPAEGGGGGGGGGGSSPPPGGQAGGGRPGDPNIVGGGSGFPVVAPN